MWMLLRTFVSGLEYSSLVRKILMATREEHFAFFFSTRQSAHRRLFGCIFPIRAKMEIYRLYCMKLIYVRYPKYVVG